MAEHAGEKKHPATERRRQKAREQGQIVRSQDLTSAALLMAALATLKWLGSDAVAQLTALLVHCLSEPQLGPFTTGDAHDRLLFVSGRLGLAVAPILIAMFAAAVLVNVSQTGLWISTSKLAPDLNHINPLKGMKRIASLQGVVRLGFGIFKVGVIAAVAYAAILRWRDPVLELASLPLPQVVQTLFDCLLGTCLWIGSALLTLAILEYAFQWWKHEQDLRMSDQELRDEMKESQGDPQMAARRRQVQRQLVMQRIGSEVPKADVVVTNPTELAIAIAYDPATMPAPVVIAKGAGVLAQRIRRLALEHGVPIVERKPLAQVLYKTVDVGGSIPLEQYQAVAEVLRYVYQLQGKSVPKAAA